MKGKGVGDRLLGLTGPGALGFRIQRSTSCKMKSAKTWSVCARVKMSCSLSMVYTYDIYI